MRFSRARLGLVQSISRQIYIDVLRQNEHEGDVRPAFTGSLYFRVRDVDSLWSLLKDEARVCYPIENFAYGMREFAVYDNNGYLLQFGEPAPSMPPERESDGSD